MKSGLWSGTWRTGRPALAAALLFTRGLVAPPAAEADVMDWMNRQLGGMFGVGSDKSKADHARMDG